MNVVKSKNNVSIRLPGECIAVREIEKSKYINEIYRRGEECRLENVNNQTASDSRRRECD